MIFSKSEELYERAKQVIPGGISSNVRRDWEPFPLFYSHGEGSRVWDVDGNEYIDYVLARGPLFYGHSPTRIIEAMDREYRNGIMYAGQSELEVLAAEKICEIVPGAEMVRFGSTGSESVHAALRLARATTGRPLILRFVGHYHGWFDNIAWSFAPPLEEIGSRENPKLLPCTLGQLDSDAEGLRLLPWNDLDVVRELFEKEGDRIAGIITEPIMCNCGCIQPLPGFLEGLREVCDEYGSLLVFDEVITGFRVAPGGAQELFGVTPDVATYAKAMGGGACISALAGKSKYMRLFGEMKTLHAGTYNANPPTMAACLAALEMLTENDNQLWKQVHGVSSRLIEGIQEIQKETDLKLAVRG
ncbi:MAG: aspartate aminotransferase family protein, partial [Candidatus Omnitrophica bacterium]|nr:aspartate aminotransferase family protein [Candidatus Omnitrophota bacterium]